MAYEEGLNRFRQFAAVQDEARAVFLQKNADYGDAFSKHGPIGVLIRMGDKLQRLTHISRTEIALVDDETLRDTAMDLHNYSAMLVMLLDENDE